MTLLPDPHREGFVEVPGGRVWYAIVGDGPGVPLLTVHGGPGFPHPYLAPLAALADERPVVFYDQLGCGQSDRPDDPALWHLDRFVAELGALRQALGLSRVHLFGHSYGTMLAVDYALTQPAGLVSLTLASPCLSVARWAADQAALQHPLPADVRGALAAHQAAGTTDAPEHQAIARAYYQAYLCPFDSTPDALRRSQEKASTTVYETMWGPSEAEATGTLAGYERAERLRELAVPTLFTCGRYDEATPATTAWYQRHLPNSELAVFEYSAHMPHLEEPESYVEALGEFLGRAERD